MSAASYTPSTSSSDLDTLWKTVQLGVWKCFNFGVEEYNALMSAAIQELNIDWSARSITFEADINDELNVASIPEGGYEARPSSVEAVTGTLTWILFNARFTVSLTAKYIDQQQGTRPQLVNQMKFQAMKKVQAIRRKFGDYVYGFSTGVLAHVATYTGGDPSITIDNMYGVTSLGGTSANRKATDLFRVGEFYAILTSGGALRGIFSVTAITEATASLTMSTTVTNTADGDLIVAAASLENTTIAGTDYNRGLPGLLDMNTSTSLHNISGGTYSQWAASLANTSGGRFNGVKLRKLQQAISNSGGGKLTDVWWTQGIENDVFDQAQAGLRYSEAFGMEISGSPKSKGVKFMSTQRVPDGYVFGFDRNNSIKKSMLLPEPKDGVEAFGPGEKIPDISGMVYSLDVPFMLFTKNRANMGYYSGLTEQ